MIEDDVKKMARSLSLEHRFQLAQAKEDAGETTIAAYLRSLNNIEATRSLFQKIRYVEGKLRDGATTQVIIKNDNKEIEEIHDQIPMEAAIIKNNESKYHQTEGSSQLLFEESIEMFGNDGRAIRLKMF